MGGQVLGGGVIVLVAALLWLVYLLPSWQSRHQFYAAERNAVRLNQALRILAETSETPQEVHLELTARTALAQQRLAKRAAAEREHAELESARADLDAARAERLTAHALPGARRTRARRRARLTLTLIGVTAIGLAMWGGWVVVTTGSQVLLWSGVALALLCGVLLRRMSRVGRRAVPSTAAAPVVGARVPAVMPDLVDDRRWTPRSLPEPLVSAAGSRAAAQLDSVEAQQRVRAAARAEALRVRAERLHPAPFDLAAARASHEDTSAAFARLASGDDAQIEEHVRLLLAARAVS